MCAPAFFYLVIDQPEPDAATGARFPGCAFTRSLGDAVAERHCGVVAAPECLSRPLCPGRDRCVLLASDGVFEFLTSRTVASIVAQFELAPGGGCPARSQGEGAEACAAVAAEAYRQWLLFEVGCRRTHARTHARADGRTDGRTTTDRGPCIARHDLQ